MNRQKVSHSSSKSSERPSYSSLTSPQLSTINMSLCKAANIAFSTIFIKSGLFCEDSFVVWNIWILIISHECVRHWFATGFALGPDFTWHASMIIIIKINTFFF